MDCQYDGINLTQFSPVNFAARIVNIRTMIASSFRPSGVLAGIQFGRQSQTKKEDEPQRRGDAEKTVEKLLPVHEAQVLSERV